MTELTLFGSTFLAVFALGFQSLNVNNGHYFLAFVTSIAIGGANLALYKLAPDATGVQILAYLSGGPLGIICAMRAHGWMRKRLKEREAYEADRVGRNGRNREDDSGETSGGEVWLP